MSHIGSNIRKIRTVKKLSQAAFAELFGLARPSVGAWEEGRAEPKTDTLIQIAQHFGVSVDLLLTKELTVNDLYHFDLYQHQRQVLDGPPAPAGPVGADQQQHLTPFVAAGQQLEYGMRCQDAHWIDSLPRLTLPHELGPATRAFEVTGSEMAWGDQQGLRPRDVVVGARLNMAALALRAGQLYAFVRRDGLLIRRVLAPTLPETVRLRADNPDYADTDLSLGEIVEIWELHAVVTAVPRPPVRLEDRLAQLERLVADLRK